MGLDRRQKQKDYSETIKGLKRDKTLDWVEWNETEKHHQKQDPDLHHWSYPPHTVANQVQAQGYGALTSFNYT